MLCSLDQLWKVETAFVHSSKTTSFNFKIRALLSKMCTIHYSHKGTSCSTVILEVLFSVIVCIQQSSHMGIIHACGVHSHLNGCIYNENGCIYNCYIQYFISWRDLLVSLKHLQMVWSFILILFLDLYLHDLTKNIRNYFHFKPHSSLLTNSKIIGKERHCCGEGCQDREKRGLLNWRKEKKK